MKNKLPNLDGFIADLDAVHLNALQAAINAAFEAEEMVNKPPLPLQDWHHGVLVATFDYMPSTVSYVVAVIRLMRPHEVGLTPEDVQQGFAGYLKFSDGRAPLILIKSPNHE